MIKYYILTVLLFGALVSKAQFTNLLNFNSTNGLAPWGSLYYDGVYLYGMTTAGGTTGNGLIFKIKPDGTGYDTLVNFNFTNGSTPYGTLISDGTYLYGMASFGYSISNPLGGVFKIKPDGTGFDTLIVFNGINGGNPYGSLYSDGTYLYGMTRNGGHDSGLIFKIKPNGTGYIDIHDFSGIYGFDPQGGSLISDGTYLYGMTFHGGISNDGVIFKIKSDGTGYSDILNFGGTNGKYPYGSLIYDGTFIYGMTINGGKNDSGLVFKIKPDGSGYADILDFDTINGSHPWGSLYFDGNYLYGMTNDGGRNHYGLIFKIKPDGSGYVDMFDFNASNGSFPFGSLISDGTYLYGMSTGGGSSDDGIVFKINKTATGIQEINLETSAILFPNPTKGSITWTGVQTGQVIYLYNALGQELLHRIIDKPRMQLDLSKIPSGIYMAKILGANGVLISQKKIVKVE